MVSKGNKQGEKLCIEKEDATDIVTLTEDLLVMMTKQAKRLKEAGRNVEGIQQTIKDVKTRLRVAKTLIRS